MSDQLAATPEKIRKRRRLLRWSIAALAVVLLGYASYYFEQALRFQWQMRKGLREIAVQAPQIRAEWDKEFGPLDEIPRRFPKTEKNESATRLEDWFAKSELDPAKSVAKQLDDYIAVAFAEPHTNASKPPPELQKYFDQNKVKISTLRGYLHVFPLPIWSTDLEKGPSAPIPNLLLMSRLQKLLAADALIGISDGNEVRAAEDLKAGWLLQKSVEDRPELVSQLIFNSSARYSVGILRKMWTPPKVWVQQLALLQNRKNLHAAMEVEVYGLSRVSLTQEMTEPITQRSKPVSANERAYLNAMVLDVQRAMVARVRSWQEQDPCEQKSTAYAGIVEPAEWNLIGSIAMPNVGSAWMRANRLRLDAEATSKLLQVRAAREIAADHLWPAVIPGIESTICMDQHWIYEISSDRKTMSLRYSATLDWPGLKGPKLPMSFTETAP